MKKIVVSLLFVGILLIIVPTAFGAEYEAMPEVDVDHYQAAPIVQVLHESSTVEIPEELVLLKDGKVFMSVKAFEFIPGLRAYEDLDGQPLALLRDNTKAGGLVWVYLKLQQHGEEKAFFVGSDGNTYLPLRETCENFSINLELKKNIISLQKL